MIKRGERRGSSRYWWTIGAAVAAALFIVGAATTWLTVHPVEVTVAGAPHAADSTGKSDEDQIRDVLQAISDAYNRKDVKGAEDNLCAHIRAQWSPQLESVWMTYRLRHGAAEFTVTSVDVTGAAAHVTGTQTYANDGRPHDFTAEMGRAPYGWKMCSST
ncbi:MAG: hypothetical protein NVS4B6_22560 [Mycobacterium sp.]